MALIQIESLLEPIDPDAPCGADLEYDPEFLALAKLANPPPRERLVGPDVPAEEPAWSNVLAQAIALHSRTKDLRVATILIKAALRTGGVAGLAQGSALLRALVERYWPAVHPHLDEDGDGTMRINVLRGLCDRQGMLSFLRGLPLVSVSGLGSFSLKDLAHAAGEAPQSGAADAAKLDAAVANCDLTQLQATLSGLASSVTDLRAVESWVTEQLGAQQALRFEELTGTLEQMQRLLHARAGTRLQPESVLTGTPANDGGTQAVTQLPTQRTVTGPIQSRADVQRTLDLLCAYYDQHEPSSPVPLLLKRARRLAAMSFMDIVRDLAPGGAAEVEAIRGPDTAENR